MPPFLYRKCGGHNHAHLFLYKRLNQVFLIIKTIFSFKDHIQSVHQTQEPAEKYPEVLQRGLLLTNTEPVFLSERGSGLEHMLQKNTLSCSVAFPPLSSPSALEFPEGQQLDLQTHRWANS